MNPSLAIITLCITMLLTMVGFYNVESAKESYENVCEVDDLTLPRNLDEYVSENTMLSRGFNAKTLIPLNESMKIRSHDHIAWRNNDMSIPTYINDQTPFDMMSSGYSSNRDEIMKNKTYLNHSFASLPEISTADVVDPRFTGYGPTDRCYIDPHTGAAKYFYNDIDAIRMPNYISRNHIDIYPWAPSYGSGYDGRYEQNSSSGYMSVSDLSTHNRGLTSIKQNALDAYTNNTGKAREELQESLMRKRNGEMWQLRVAPIHR